MTERNEQPAAGIAAEAQAAPSNALLLLVCWLAVGLPLAWGVAQTLKKARALFA